MKRFDAAEIKYCPGMYDPDFKVEKMRRVNSRFHSVLK